MHAIKLDYPLTFGTKTINELSCRERLKAVDYKSFGKPSGAEQRIALIASVAGVDELVVEALDGVDYLKASAYCDTLLEQADAEFFKATAPATGEIELTQAQKDAAKK